MKKTKLLTVKNIVLIAMLSALAALLIYLEFPLWFAPPFYELDFSEIPILIGAFMMGPAAGFIMEVLKIMLKLILKGSNTMGVGDWANILIGSAFIVPASMVYSRVKTKKGALIGMGLGILTMTIAGCFLNAYVLLPTYAAAFDGAWQGFMVMAVFTVAIAFPVFFFYRKGDRKQILIGIGIEIVIVATAVILMHVIRLFSEDSLSGLISAGTAVNPAINNVWTFVIFAVAPFNLLKGTIVSFVTFLIYKRISGILKGKHE